MHLTIATPESVVALPGSGRRDASVRSRSSSAVTALLEQRELGRQLTSPVARKRWPPRAAPPWSSPPAGKPIGVIGVADEVARGRARYGGAAAQHGISARRAADRRSRARGTGARRERRHHRLPCGAAARAQGGGSRGADGARYGVLAMVGRRRQRRAGARRRRRRHRHGRRRHAMPRSRPPTWR